MRAEKAEPLLVRTQDLRRRLQRILGPLDPTSKRLNLRELARGIRYRLTGSKFEQTLTYYTHAKQIFPKRYRALMRLRTPAVLKVSLRNAYPRCYVTRHIPVDDSGSPTAGAYYGPFPSRKSADAFSEKALDFFRIRRCQIKIRRDPAFPGCIYSEMKMSLAPCFAGCTDQEYASEVSQVVEFLSARGASLSQGPAREREAASSELDFERAAAQHRRLEKVDAVRRGLPELVRQLDHLDAVILERAAETNTIAAFVVSTGRIAEPFLLRFDELASQSRSAEEIFRKELQPAD